MHAAFVADEIWYFMLEAPRKTSHINMGVIIEVCLVLNFPDVLLSFSIKDEYCRVSVPDCLPSVKVSGSDEIFPRFPLEIMFCFSRKKRKIVRKANR